MGFQPVAAKVDVFGFCVNCRERKKAEIRAQWRAQHPFAELEQEQQPANQCWGGRLMTTQSVETSIASPAHMAPAYSPSSVFDSWKSNYELILAAVTLIALLIGWIGGSVTGALPQWAVTAAAVVAFGAGGYSGLMGAIAEARHGRLDIDFLMITAALGAALIGEWEEGRAPVVPIHPERRTRRVRHGSHAQGHRGASRSAAGRGADASRRRRDQPAGRTTDRRRCGHGAARRTVAGRRYRDQGRQHD